MYLFRFLLTNVLPFSLNVIIIKCELNEQLKETEHMKLFFVYIMYSTSFLLSAVKHIEAFGLKSTLCRFKVLTFACKIVCAHVQPLLLVHGLRVLGNSPEAIPGDWVKTTRERCKNPNLKTVYKSQSSCHIECWLT